MSETIQVKSESTYSEILRTAYELFIEQGYHGTSMRQIAQRAGIALGGIYNHFSSKEEVFRSVFFEYYPLRTMLPAVAAAQGDTIEEFVKDAASRMMEGLGNRQDHLHLMFIEFIEFKSAHIPELFKTYFPEVTQVAQRLLQWDGKLRPIPLPIIARSFLGLFFSYYVTGILLSSVAVPEFTKNGMDYFVDIYLHGILAGEEPKTSDQHSFSISLKE